MLLAAGSDALSTGNLIVGLVTFLTALGGVSYQFVMRREYIAHRESADAKFVEHGRRIAKLEDLNPPAGNDYVAHARRNADAHTDIERRVATEIAAVKTKMGEMGERLGGIEPELLWQSKLLRALANKLKIQIP